MKLTKYAFAILAVALLAGCSSVGNVKPVAGTDIKDYNYRWRHLDPVYTCDYSVQVNPNLPCIDPSALTTGKEYQKTHKTK